MATIMEQSWRTHYQQILGSVEAGNEAYEVAHATGRENAMSYVDVHDAYATHLRKGVKPFSQQELGAHVATALAHAADLHWLLTHPRRETLVAQWQRQNER